MREYLRDLPLWSDPEATRVLLELCDKYRVPSEVIGALVALQRERQYQERADGVYSAIAEALDQIE